MMTINTISISIVIHYVQCTSTRINIIPMFIHKYNKACNIGR